MDEKTPWKRLRTTILQQLVRCNFHDYELPPIPTNAVRSHQRMNFLDLPLDQQERALFDDFLSICRGFNGPYIQCMQTTETQVHWEWGKDEHKQRVKSPNLERWMADCFTMGNTLFDLQIIISDLREDITRGPTVYTFCSLVLNHLQRSVFAELRALDNLEVKSLLTLKRHCLELNSKLLTPLRDIAKEISLNDKVGGELINFLFDQKARSECYHIASLLDEIISMALLRYNQVIYEWISQCTLSMDLAHEFFIWDLRKQNVVNRNEFERPIERDDWIDFDDTFVRIPELLPKDYQPVAKEMLNLGRYLYTMKQQKADMEHLSTQYLLDLSAFKDKSLGEFCAAIHNIYGTCSMNILNHFRKRFDIVNLARHLPYFFVGIDSAWIYEFVVLFEATDMPVKMLDNIGDEGEHEQFNSFLQQLLEKAFHVSWLQNSPFHTKIRMQYSMLSHLKNSPNLVLNIVVDESAPNKDGSLALAFPARVMWPYRHMFYHLFVLNRARHLMHEKYFTLNGTTSRAEFATVHQFLRFLNVYMEYICGVASAACPTFAKKLDSVHTLDELVDVQVEYTHVLMEQMKLDQDFVQLRQWIVELANTFCNYARDLIDFCTLNKVASPLVGRIKLFLLSNRRSGGPLRDLLFGCYFTAIGETAADEEPIWRLLFHVGDEIAIAAAVRCDVANGFG